MTRGPLCRWARWLVGLCLVLLLLAGLPGKANAFNQRSTALPEASDISRQDRGDVVEQLRLRVPAAAREAWLTAERQSWEPWLRQQDGFLGRELLWDGQREEGLLLIRWRSRRQWLAIPERDIAAVQRQFEASARRALALDPAAGEGPTASNPFPLVFAGELEPVGLTPAGEAEAVP
ncbi:TIGR03792 family protein [Synechococcus sp. BA-132 BA5]|nr:TIGR03792 family protein [Synechococcus sp. BA-132 BA5]